MKSIVKKITIFAWTFMALMSAYSFYNTLEPSYIILTFCIFFWMIKYESLLSKIKDKVKKEQTFEEYVRNEKKQID